MRHFRAAAGVSLAATLALAAGGCGSGSTAASGGAVLVPASVAVFASVDTDSGSGQWQAAEVLLDKFPGGSELVAKALQGLDDENLDYEADVEPALGPETDVVVLTFENDPPVVVLTQPDDPAKFKQLAESGDDPAVVAELEDGWWAAAKTQAELDAFAAAREDGDALADHNAYEDAMGKLPADALATVYVDAGAIGQAASGAESGALPFGGQALTACLGGQSAGNSALALAIRAEEGGVRLNAAGTGAASLGEPATVGLDGFLPGGALAFVDLQVPDEALQKALACLTDSSPELSQGLAQAQLALGVSVEELLTTLLGGEAAVAVYGPGSLGAAAGADPVVVVASEVEDEGKALELVNGLLDRAALFSDGGVAAGPASVEGMDAKSILYDGRPVAFYGTRDGKFVVSNSEAGLSALGGGSNLADDAAYSSARAAAGAPDEAGSLVYVNLRVAIGLAGAALAPAESAPEVLANTKPLQSLLLWSTGSGDDAATEGFVEIG